MWKLHSNGTIDDHGLNKRLYRNSVTNNECTQTMVYTDRDANQWWEFDNLTSIPYTRNFAATKISSLYALGLSRDDLTGFFTKHKATLKSSDPEKYEKAYAELLEFEAKAESATDAIKQMSSLVCVYYTINDEAIDSWDNNLQIKKMAMLEADIKMHTFFLTRQIDHTERYSNFLNSISQIALPSMEGLLEVTG